MPDLMQDRNINQPRDTIMPPMVPSAQMDRRRHEQTTTAVAAGGSLAEACCGIAGLALAIVALADIWPRYTGGVAAIVIGAGLVLEGASIATRFATMMGEMMGARSSTGDLGGGMSAGFAAGAAGIVLGILALIGIVPATLFAVTAIVYGAGLLLGALGSARLNNMIVERQYQGREAVQQVAGAMVSGSSGAQVLVGLADIVLGIVAVVGVATMSLSMIAFLVAGASLIISGLALSAKMLSVVRS